MSLRLVLIVLALSTLALLVHGTFVVESPDQFKGDYKLALISPWTQPSNAALVVGATFVQNGRLVTFRFSPGLSRRPEPAGSVPYCFLLQDVPNEDRDGAIVIYDSDWQGIYLVDLLIKFQRENASAVILGTSYCTQFSNQSVLFDILKFMKMIRAAQLGSLSRDIKNKPKALAN